jgi:hypothetical protein
VLGLVVRTLVGASEDDVGGVVSVGLNDGGETLLSDGEEGVGRGGGSDGVNLDMRTRRQRE